MRSDAVAYKLNIVSASLFVKKVSVSPAVRLGHAQALLSTTAKYPIDKQYPSKPLQSDYGGGSAVREFYQLALASGKHLKNQALSIDREDFLQGYTLYAFNLTPDEVCGQHLSLIKAGNIRLEERFRQPLPAQLI
ncbi:hypothetical protein H4Q32_028279 [Labeo rohita]|uniref:Uncharacterized protein n=1 Tax=Labeo rohita TaxID=84645 RepID=A0ABQ8L6N4_LABRO|nr:hypothetical protein H4Q32_028279 [Labeo rohita]